jgi:alkylation response protein AidB-like acyl-CoA dehydrogenase
MHRAPSTAGGCNAEASRRYLLESRALDPERQRLLLVLPGLELVFRMAMPKAWGGPELDLLSQMRVIEALSIADASAGWCAMIGVDGGYMTAYIDQTVARGMYTDIDSVTAVTFAPPGRAVETRNGFTVNGRWPFASGCQHATWLIGHFAHL